MNKKFLVLNAALVAAFLTSCGGKGDVSQESLTVSTEPTSESTSSSESMISSEESVSDTIAVNAAKRAEEGSPVVVEAKVLAKNPTGIFVGDETGSIYVYTATSDIDLTTIALGSLVKVSGYASVYSMAHQISTTKVDETTLPVSIEVLENGSGEVEVSYQTKTIAEVDDEDNENVDFFGSPIVVRGTVKYNGSYNNPYCVQDGAGHKVVLSRNPGEEKDIAELKSRLVEVKGFVYAYEAGSFSLVTMESNELTSEEVSDEEAVDAAIHLVKGELDGKSTSESLTLITEYLGASITYVSSNESVLGSDGEYKSPSAPCEIKYAVTVTRGTTTKNAEVTVNVLILTKKKVVISESYTAGGNKNATYGCDFVELYNQTDEDVDLSGYSIQNAATSASSQFAVHALSGTIKAHDYFLIVGTVSNNDAAQFGQIEDYDLSCEKFNPGATNYTLALCSSTTKITRSEDGKTILTGDVVDLLGVGSSLCPEGEAISISGNINSVQRKDVTVDTDNNKNDFKVDTPNPTKSAE